MKPILLLLCLCATAAAQSESEEIVTAHQTADDHDGREAAVSGRPIPVPYLYVGPSLMGGGYATLAYRAEGGLAMEATHIVFRAGAAYDDGHKVNDGDQPNPKGHDRDLDASLYFRPARSGWTSPLYFGGGYRWSQLSTSNYTKGGSRYLLGGGCDLFLRSCESCRRDYSMRIEVNWLTAGTDWQNGSHGLDTRLTWPSPREKRHWFFRWDVDIYRYHQTVTEPTNIPLAIFQRSQKYFDRFSDFGLIYRF